MRNRWSLAAGIAVIVTAAWAAASATGCATDPPPADKTLVCEGMASSKHAVTAVDRKILGEASPYPPDTTLAARELELRGSMRARRELGWQVALRTLAPVTIAEERLADPVTGLLPVVPRFRTWYGKDDFQRMFKQLYADLGPAGRAARAAFGDPALAAIFPWNVAVLDGLPNWPEERYAEYLAALDEPITFSGVGGSSRVAFSPAAMRHIYAGYTRELECLAAPLPPPSAGGTVVPGAPASVVERGTATTCAWLTHGPYFVADGAELEARLAGDHDVDLYVRRGEAPTADAYDCRSNADGPASGAGEACALVGPGAFYVAVAAYADASDFELRLDYLEADSASFAPCFPAEFPAASAVVKAQWERAQFGQTVAVYDTSAARMAERLAPAASGDWADGDGQADPGPALIHTVRLDNGNEYRMPALHIMTKELSHWVWVTLWWSPEPDVDFGADRPDFIRALGPPWDQYKMCVVTSFVEGSADPGGGHDADAPSLAAALAATHEGAGGPTWCSNPYIERGAHNARSTCIGCHQHAGTPLLAPQIIGDDAHFPHAGRMRVRDNFPADYLWSLGFGDDLARVMQDEVDYYDSFE